MANCERCGKEFEQYRPVQRFCADCRDIHAKEYKHSWYRQKYPDAKPKTRRKDKCCICGEPFSTSFEGKPYCNKHYLRMYLHGDAELHPRKHGNPYEVIADIAIFTTHDGRKFIADAEDVEKIIRYTWCYSKTGYLVATVHQKTTKLQRYLLDPPENMVVDHKNGHPSDNRRSNLRICTQTDNTRNAAKPKNSRCKYVGVSKTKNGTYKARIMVNRKEIRLGTYKTEEEAFAARIAGEKKYYGEFGRQAAQL